MDLTGRLAVCVPQFRGWQRRGIFPHPMHSDPVTQSIPFPTSEHCCKHPESKQHWCVGMISCFPSQAEPSRRPERPKSHVAQGPRSTHSNTPTQVGASSISKSESSREHQGSSSGWDCSTRPPQARQRMVVIRTAIRLRARMRITTPARGPGFHHRISPSYAKLAAPFLSFRCG